MPSLTICDSFYPESPAPVQVPLPVWGFYSSVIDYATLHYVDTSLHSNSPAAIFRLLGLSQSASNFPGRLGFLFQAPHPRTEETMRQIDDCIAKHWRGRPLQKQLQRWEAQMSFPAATSAGDPRLPLFQEPK